MIFGSIFVRNSLNESAGQRYCLTLCQPPVISSVHVNYVTEQHMHLTFKFAREILIFRLPKAECTYTHIG